jgi:4-hydroxybenzoate polyprenyltransferase
MRSSDRTLGRGRLADYLALARISNSPTVVSNTLAGAALAGLLAPDGRVWLLALAFVALYTAGMVLNDVCDYRIDLRERPERPLPSGRVGRGAALGLALGLFAAGLALVALVSWRASGWALGLVGVIAAYDLWHKTNPLSPLVMAAARALVYLTAIAALGASLGWPAASASGLLFGYIVGLTFIAKCELRPSFGAIWPAALVILPVGVLAVRFNLPALAIGLVLLAWVTHSLSFVYRAESRSIGGAITRLIAGVSLYDALVCAAWGSAAGALGGIVAFGLTLFLQRFIRGT